MKRSQIKRQYVETNRKFEAMFMPSIQKAIASKTAQVRIHLRQGGFSEANEYLSRELTNEALTRVIRTLYSTIGRRHAQLTYSRLLKDRTQKKGFGFNERWTQFILQYLNQFLLQKITFEVNNTTRDALLKALAEGTEKGWSIDQMVDHLQHWPFERFQAARIARTETNRAANVGNKAQAETSEYQQQKEWISAQDFRVRGRKPKDHADHWKLNGTKVDEDDVFIDPRNGDRLMFPGDPKASAASTVNCRCVAAYTLKRDAQGNPIKKRQTTSVVFPGQQRRPVVVQPRRTTTVIQPGDIRRPQTVTI